MHPNLDVIHIYHVNLDPDFNLHFNRLLFIVNRKKCIHFIEVVVVCGFCVCILWIFLSQLYSFFDDFG